MTRRQLHVDKPPTCAGEWLMPPGQRGHHHTTLFGKTYVWHLWDGRWSLHRVIKREGPSPWKLIGATEDGKRLFVAPAGTDPRA